MVGSSRFIFLLVVLLLLPGYGALWGDAVVIDSVEISITGHTREQAVRTYLDIGAGSKFKNREELEAFIEQKEQELKNARVFRESSIKYTVVEEPEEETETITRIALTVSILDGWTFYPIPLYQYSSSYGHMFMGVVYDTNLFGSMVTGMFVLRYNRELFSTSLVLNKIRLFGIPWNTIFRYEYVEQIKQEDGTVTFHYDRKSINFGIGAAPPITGDLYYDFLPSIEYRFDYHLRSGEPDEAYIPPGITLLYDHSVGIDTVNWYRNFKKGLAIELNHIIGYTPLSGLITNKFRPEISGFTYAGPIGVSGRITGFGRHGVERTGAGKELRGVIDNSLWGDRGVYGNADIAMRLATVGKAFEIQVKTFTDLGFVLPKDEVFTLDAVQTTAGFGILAYPLVAPGMVINFACGFNLTNPGEIEVVFNFQEFY
jgi:hypothetical protein